MLALVASAAHAQPVPATRVSVLLAEDSRAPTPRELATLQAAARSADAQTGRLALRALGRLERPAVLPTLVPALDHPLPETRAEAANAVAQASQGWKSAKPQPGPWTPASVLAALIASLDDEEESSVRAAICESIGRLPYGSAEEVGRAESALLDVAGTTDTITDRLGIVKGFEALVRLHRSLKPATPRALALLRKFAGVQEKIEGQVGGTGQAGQTAHAGPAKPRMPDPPRDARVRRLALEALIAAGAIDEAIVARASRDPDAQVRRLAVRAAASARLGAAVAPGIEDPAPMVRIEAVKVLHDGVGIDRACHLLLTALADTDVHVALTVIDELGRCESSPYVALRLEGLVNDLSTAGSPRGWHRAAHAIVALAQAAPPRAAAALGQFTGSTNWWLRMYAARAATVIGDREVLERLARDPSDNVVEAAVEGLVKVAGHKSDALYVSTLSRAGHQAVRAAALALDGSPEPAAAVPALKAALERLTAQARRDTDDTRAVLATVLTEFGIPSAKPPRPPSPASVVIDSAELRRLAAPRARVAIAGLGSFELALFTSEAPATVLRFARLAESGYYNALTFHRVLPNFAIQGGSPGANEYIGHPDHMRDEVGLWPHVRGAAGISTRGRDTGDAQIFIDLVDNPRFDHEYTVFGQVLNGMDVVDQILEGDIIERIAIIP